MRASTKYPVFLVFTTLLTGLGVSLAMAEVLKNALEREIVKRGEATVESFALANAPLLLTYPSERAKARLKYNLLAVAKNPDVLKARLSDNEGNIIATVDDSELGTALPAIYLDPEFLTTWQDADGTAYHFRAPVRYGSDVIGMFVLSLSQRPKETALVRARNKAFGYAGGIAAMIAIFALLLVRRELRPLKEMRLALSEIARGDFSQRVPEKRNDEIGELSSAFNRMLKRSELFFHYVDKMVIDRLIADESLARPGGREADMAVIFGDMRGYTAMSNRRTANEVVHIVNTYFYLFIESVAHWSGFVDKTMGDAIMAVFERKDDEDSEGHKRRGVLALAYMKAASRVLNRFLLIKAATGETLTIEPREFGFAMATGRAIVGNIGSKRRMDYTVCGRVVNLSSRLEGLTKFGETIIDNFTHLGTTDLIHAEPLPPVQPKGYREDEKVVPHRLTGLSTDETHRLRIFLKKIFVYSFLHDMVMPKSLPVGEQQPWCQEAELLLIKIIAETPVTDFFSRADVETGRILGSTDPRIGPPERRSEDAPRQPTPSDDAEPEELPADHLEPLDDAPDRPRAQAQALDDALDELDVEDDLAIDADIAAAAVADAPAPAPALPPPVPVPAEGLLEPIEEEPDELDALALNDADELASPVAPIPPPRRPTGPTAAAPLPPEPSPPPPPSMPTKEETEAEAKSENLTDIGWPDA